MSKSKDVAEAVGAEGETLEQRAERLRQVVATPTERDIAARELMAVEQQIAERDRAALNGQVQRRLLGIRKALGSILDQLEQDEHRAIAAAREFVAVITALNERFERAVSLRHEGRALAEVFEISDIEFPAFTPPAQREQIGEAFAAVTRAGVRDNGFVRPTTDDARRRTFDEPELAGSAGRELIRRKLGK